MKLSNKYAVKKNRIRLHFECGDVVNNEWNGSYTADYLVFIKVNNLN